MTKTTKHQDTTKAVSGGLSGCFKFFAKLKSIRINFGVFALMCSKNFKADFLIMVSATPASIKNTSNPHLFIFSLFFKVST